MKSKTCGECRFFVTNPGHGGCCTFICDAMCDDDRACDSFEKLTNGDRIRQMSNDELMKFKEMAWCFYCAYHVDGGGRFTENCNKPAGKTCADGNKEWLNAPAESEVSDE